MSQRIQGNDYLFDVAEVKSSAGAVSLILQSIMPSVAFASESSKVILKGGTHVPWSPPFHYLKDVFLPLLKKMGIEASAEIIQWGWYPRGQGSISFSIKPMKMIKSINLKERGDLKSLHLISAVSHLPLSIAERQRDRALEILKMKDLTVRTNLIEAPSIGPGTFLFILAQFDNCLAGFSSLGEKGKRAEVVADEACQEFLQYLNSNACLDKHLSDQIIPYLALAEGESTFTTVEITRHTLTNIWAIEKFLPVKFKIVGKEGKAGKISVKGIGYINPNVK